MVRIYVETPDDPHPDMVVPLKFVDGCLASDVSIVELADDAIENCRRLRADHPGDPAILHLSGIIAFIMTNPEGAKRFWGEALMASPDYEHAQIALKDVLVKDPAWKNAEAYLDVASRGPEALVGHYGERARRAFDAGDLEAADKWLQRISGYNNPTIAQLNDVEKCRRETADLRNSGEWASALDKVAAKYQRYWGGIGDEDIRKSVQSYAHVPDRSQLADIVCRCISEISAGDKSVVELGCYAGFNLQNAHDRLAPADRAGLYLLGVEPNASACRLGAELSPAVSFLQGGLREVTEGVLELPGHMDVCLISRVLMILKPDVVARILDHLAPRVSCLIICDDIGNFGGAEPVIRTPPEFIIVHNFERMLDDAGFRVAELIMAEVPDRECTGFIVAKSRHPAS